MKLTVLVDQDELKCLVIAHLKSKLGDTEFSEESVRIETKSKQNYKSEWESGAGFRATMEVDV